MGVSEADREKVLRGSKEGFYRFRLKPIRHSSENESEIRE